MSTSRITSCLDSLRNATLAVAVPYASYAVAELMAGCEADPRLAMGGMYETRQAQLAEQCPKSLVAAFTIGLMGLFSYGAVKLVNALDKGNNAVKPKHGRS